MLRLAIMAYLLLATTGVQAGFGDTLPPEAYVDPVDQEIARTGKGIDGRPYPCARKIEEGEIDVIELLPAGECVRMLPQQHWRGLWRNDFEGSRFCPAPARECSFDTAGDDIWLDKGTGQSGLKRDAFGGLYEIEFFGRRTMFRGPYGHMGGSDHEIIVDRVISLRVIEPPPPPPTQAEIEAEWKRCEAAGNCISMEKLGDLRKRE